ncbi:hypothetical protein TPB0596_12240 [Tsukamurella pulmonis]|nr:hypothetical protein TPB0596_12240 [Tsukamurella pulmonis]
MDPSQVESAVCPQLFASMKQAGASQTPIPGVSQAERQKPDGDIEFAGKILSSAADGDYAAAYVEQKFSVRPNRVETPLVGFLRTGGRWKVCVFDMSKPAPPLPSAVPGATLGPVR